MLADKAQRSDHVVAAARAVDLVMVVEMDPLLVSTGSGSIGGYARFYRFSEAERADGDQLHAGGDTIAASHNSVDI